MSSSREITLSNFIVRLKSWEYWPFGIIHFPVIIYFLWLALKARSLLFFSASNPGIVMGGMFGESKYDVLKKVDPRYTPMSVLVDACLSHNEIVRKMESSGLRFPVIFKPDLGERGFMVQRINNKVDVENYLQRMKYPFIIQELIDLPLEFGVFYLRFPQWRKGKVTSIVMKQMLSVTGDGVSTLRELILRNERARLRWEVLKKTYAEQLENVLDSGETKELVSIGNHCLGTKFLDGSHLINERLSTTFDQISQSIEGFNFGRFDLRCETIEDLYAGRIKVLELNGCGAEPAHIYDPDFSLIKAVGVLLDHWRNIFLIARENAKRGASYINFKEARMHYRKFKAATQQP